jgi:glutaredoxin
VEEEEYEPPAPPPRPRRTEPTGIPATPLPEKEEQPTFERPWPIAVSIKAYYKSYTDMPRLLARLEETSGYSLERHDIYKDEMAADYFNKVYKGHTRTPVIVVNGQVYTGSINDVSGLLTFQRNVQETYQDIYISCFAGRCRSCRNKGCLRYTGGRQLEPQHAYHFGIFYASSPGELMASCEMGALWVHYGKPLHEHMLFIDTPKSNALLYARKAQEFIDELRALPITTIELYLKKDSELSEDILNIIALASHYSGGKLRYTITQWDERTPGVYIDGTKVPPAYHPSSFTTLLAAIKRYAR